MNNSHPASLMARIHNLPKTNSFTSIPDMPILGLGTIWIGRRWPVGNADYTPPTQDEIETFLTTAYHAGIRMFDTAAAYGKSEERLGDFLRRHPDWAQQIFVATKWGEEFDCETELVSNNHTIDNLRTSFDRSSSVLPKIDLLYIHKADHHVLSDKEIKDEMNRLKELGKIAFTGASISNAAILNDVMANNVLWTDFLQTSADVVAARPDLITVAYENGVAVVVNSPVRKLITPLSPRDAYLTLANNPHVSFVLTGTRTHLDETIGYFGLSVSEKSDDCQNNSYRKSITCNKQ